MGLDISVYRNLKLVKTPITDEDYDSGKLVIHDGVLRWTEENWPGRAEGLQGGVYDAEDAFGFRAGSYSGYGDFRRLLCEYAHGVSIDNFWHGKIKEGAFFELLHFADNEGYITAPVSKKLAADFANNREAIVKKAEGEDLDWFVHCYDNWAKAFTLAADNGVVVFH